MPRYVAIWKDKDGNTYETSPMPTKEKAKEQAKLLLRNYQIPKPVNGIRIAETNRKKFTDR